MTKLQESDKQIENEMTLSLINILSVIWLDGKNNTVGYQEDPKKISEWVKRIEALIKAEREKAVEEYKENEVNKILNDGSPTWLLDNANRDLKKKMDKLSKN